MFKWDKLYSKTDRRRVIQAIREARESKYHAEQNVKTAHAAVEEAKRQEQVAQQDHADKVQERAHWNGELTKYQKEKEVSSSNLTKLKIKIESLADEIDLKFMLTALDKKKTESAFQLTASDEEKLVQSGKKGKQLLAEIDDYHRKQDQVAPLENTIQDLMIKIQACNEEVAKSVIEHQKASAVLQQKKSELAAAKIKEEKLHKDAKDLESRYTDRLIGNNMIEDAIGDSYLDSGQYNEDKWRLLFGLPLAPQDLEKDSNIAVDLLKKGASQLFPALVGGLGNATTGGGNATAGSGNASAGVGNAKARAGNATASSSSSSSSR